VVKGIVLLKHQNVDFIRQVQAKAVKQKNFKVHSFILLLLSSESSS